MADNGADEWPPPGHKLRLAARRSEPASAVVPRRSSGKWESFGEAVLGFHHRVAATAMCRCGRTVIECDVLAQARQHGLINE